MTFSEAFHVVETIILNLILLKIIPSGVIVNESDLVQAMPLRRTSDKAKIFNIQYS